MTDSYQGRRTDWVTNALAESASVESVHRNGREYLRFPVVALREMVYDYPEHGTREYLPAEHIRETVDAWAGVPLVFQHPENRQRTATAPEAYTGEVIGQFHDPQLVDGEKLRGNALLDVAKAEDMGGLAAAVVEKLRAGEELSVSAGYATMDDREERGTYDGESYDLVQGVPWPDHVAVFPSDEFTARCTPEDGCAAPRANYVAESTGEQATAAAATSETMSKANSGDGGRTVFETDAEREAARETLREAFGADVDGEVSDDLVDDVVDSLADDDDLGSDHEETLYLAARIRGWQPEGCAHEDPMCEHDRAALEMESGTTTNAAGCSCGGHRTGVDTDLSPDEDPAYYDGGRPVGGDGEEYPGGTRSEWDKRQGDGGETRVNYGAIPGAVDRSPDRSQTDDEMPAGGRSAWERRKLGLSETDDGEMPAGGREAWEERRENAEEDYPLSIRWRQQQTRERRNARRRRRGAHRLDRYNE